VLPDDLAIAQYDPALAFALLKAGAFEGGILKD
jgi:hypothetical protein